MKFLVSALVTGAACTVVPAFAQSTTPSSTAPAAAASAPSSAPAPVFTDPVYRWRAMASPYTIHYSHDDKHKPVWMVGLERERSDGFLLGAVYFSNSFGQPSGFVYLGQRLHDFSPYPQLYAQWSAGLMYGYRGEFQDKVPFNYGGFSPGVVLALGWQFTPRYSLQANVLGNSALMFQFAVDF